MKAKYLVLTFALAAFCTIPGWAQHTGGGSHHGGKPPICTDIPAVLTVTTQTPGGDGGISGDTDTGNTTTTYTDGDNGVYAKFQICNGTLDFVLNLRNTSNPTRYLNLDFSNHIGTEPYTTDVPADIHQQGLNINEILNFTIYNGTDTATTCAGMQLDPWNSTMIGANAWFKPSSIYYGTGSNSVLNCNGGPGPDAANSPNQTSAVKVIFDYDTCTWTVTPLPANNAGDALIGVAEVIGKGHKASWVSEGQYRMPFKFTITEKYYSLYHDEVDELGCRFRLPLPE